MGVAHPKHRGQGFPAKDTPERQVLAGVLVEEAGAEGPIKRPPPR